MPDFYVFLGLVLIFVKNFVETGSFQDGTFYIVLGPPQVCNDSVDIWRIQNSVVIIFDDTRQRCLPPEVRFLQHHA